MNHHDVGRDRGGIAAALATITADVTIAGMSSDWLYPVRLQQELGELIPTVVGRRDRADHLRPRRLPRRDRTPRPHHPPRAGALTPNISMLTVTCARGP